jgi:hypothetical protein
MRAAEPRLRSSTTRRRPLRLRSSVRTFFTFFVFLVLNGVVSFR